MIVGVDLSKDGLDKVVFPIAEVAGVKGHERKLVILTQSCFIGDVLILTHQGTKLSPLRGSVGAVQQCLHMGNQCSV